MKIYPRFTDAELLVIANIAEAVIVHPYPQKSKSKRMQDSFEDTFQRFRNLITPELVLSLVQTIQGVKQPYSFQQQEEE